MRGAYARAGRLATGSGVAGGEELGGGALGDVEDRAGGDLEVVNPNLRERIVTTASTRVWLW